MRCMISDSATQNTVTPNASDGEPYRRDEEVSHIVDTLITVGNGITQSDLPDGYTLEISKNIVRVNSPAAGCVFASGRKKISAKFYPVSIVLNTKINTIQAHVNRYFFTHPSLSAFSYSTKTDFTALSIEKENTSQVKNALYNGECFIAGDIEPQNLLKRIADEKTDSFF